MRRRTVIEGIAALAAAWPFAARAQQSAIPVIGFLSSRSASPSAEMVAAFRQSLSRAGYIEGRNVAIEYRWADGQYDRLPALAADLVRRRVDVIVATGGPPSPQAAMAATQTIPIVFTTQGDPVKEGLVPGLNRPGGNATGVTFFGSPLVAKRLDLLHQLVPKASSVAMLINPNNPLAEPEAQEAETAAPILGLQLFVVRATDESQFATAFQAIIEHRSGALYVGSDQFFNDRHDPLIALAARHSLPAIYFLRDFARAGGLMSYGNDLAELYSQAGAYTARVLNGERPAELPVIQATKFQAVLNLKTAKALGLKVPTSILLLVDEVIE